jgi:hypothetical protein
MWDFELNEVVHADLDDNYGFAQDAKFEVAERKVVEENTQLYILKSQDNGELYEAYPSMVIKAA